MKTVLNAAALKNIMPITATAALRKPKPKLAEPIVETVSAAKITEWQFNIQRDDKGFIKGMTAKAK
jgi:hypothetical protein|tara:strand:+ start:503 stop:700 length:198 start_codon:yes stop_codon:yes gene_type:complete